jgi:hypothetical protein
MDEAEKQLKQLKKEYGIEYRHHTERLGAMINYKDKQFYANYSERLDWKVDIYRTAKMLIEKVDQMDLSH